MGLFNTSIYLCNFPCCLVQACGFLACACRFSGKGQVDCANVGKAILTVFMQIGWWSEMLGLTLNQNGICDKTDLLLSPGTSTNINGSDRHD